MSYSYYQLSNYGTHDSPGVNIDTVSKDYIRGQSPIDWELTLIVRRVNGKTLGSTDEAVREMHVGLKRTADYLTHVRQQIAHYITNLPLGSRSTAKVDLRQQVNNILVPICNNLDHLKAAAKFTLLLDISLLQRNIKRLHQLKEVKPLNNHL